MPLARNLSPAQAADRLGISAKALRLYEQQGLLAPERSRAGWRLYGPEDIERASEIVALRNLGLSLAQIGRVLAGDAGTLESGLAAHEGALRQRIQKLETALGTVCRLREDILAGKAPNRNALRLAVGGAAMTLGFPLPWPWAGERFEMRDVPPLNFITGPLGSGKTRFAERLAAALPGASFIGLDRSADSRSGAERLSDTAHAARVELALTWLEEDGAQRSDALLALITALEADPARAVVVDLIEDNLCAATQQALIAYLRKRSPHGRTLFLMTRSTAILDLEAVGPEEAILYCPANHSPPFRAAHYPGGYGYEAVATCLAAPEVRARTSGLAAVRSA